MQGVTRAAIGAGTAVGVIGVDQGSKAWARDDLADRKVRPGPLGTGLELTDNHGVAFGMFADQPWVPYAGAVAGGALIGGLAIAHGAKHPVLTSVGAGLFAGGLASNMVDRTARGAVTDFLKLPSWPNFNGADMAVIAGAGALGLAVLR